MNCLRFSHFSAMFSLITLAACAGDPAARCVDTGVADTVLDLAFDKAKGAVEASSPGQQNGVDWTKGVLAQIDSMRDEAFITLTQESLVAYDKTTKLATCSARLDFHLMPDDHPDSPAAIGVELSLGGLDLPNNFYGSSPYSTVRYTTQPQAKDGTTLTSIAGFEDVQSAIIAVAYLRVAETAAKKKASEAD